MAGEHPFDQPAEQPHLGRRPRVRQEPVNLVKQLAKQGMLGGQKFVMILFGLMAFMRIVYLQWTESARGEVATVLVFGRRRSRAWQLARRRLSAL